MNINLYLKKTDKVSQESLKKHLDEKKLNRLSRLLKHGNLEIADFRVCAENSLHRPKFFFVKLTLVISKKKLVAEERGVNLLEVFDLAFNKLIFQLRKLEAVKHDT